MNVVPGYGELRKTKVLQEEAVSQKKTAMIYTCVKRVLRRIENTCIEDRYIHVERIDLIDDLPTCTMVHVLCRW